MEQRVDTGDMTDNVEIDQQKRPPWRRFLPRSLYARALIIVIAPIVILQSVLVFVFMERHWNTVTRRLSAAVTRDIAAIIKIMEAYPNRENQDAVIRIAREQLFLNITVLPPDPLPPPAPKPFFALLDRALSDEIRLQIAKPFWIDTVGRSQLVEIRIQLADSVLQVFARRSQTYASNSHIFLFWMVGTALVLMVIAILFMRNQIRPIQRLANAAEDFGRGRDHPNFRPTGALEVRRAARAFMEMRRRIQRQIEQRTAMLAGVSHDLRTILTRFKLQLAIVADQNERAQRGGRNAMRGNPLDIAALEQDVADMQTMLEGYLAFARGDADEQSVKINIETLMDALCRHAELEKKTVTRSFTGDPLVEVRPLSFKRCIDNVWGNALKYGDHVSVSGIHDRGWLSIIIEDDGPGIPQEERQNVFRPFYRIDQARNINKDNAGTGLGLAIAIDIARVHGGNIMLAESALGGLRATVRIPA